MGIKKIIKMQSPAIFAVYTLVIGVFYLLVTVFGYTFTPNNGLALNAFSATLVVFLTVVGHINRNKKTIASSIFYALLPLISIFLVITKDIASVINGINTYIYIAYAYTVLICSMTLFFFCGIRTGVKIGLGLIYSVLMIPIFFILFILIFFGNFGANTVVESKMSPNAVHLAEIIDSDQGALGGSTLVNVTAPSRNIDLFIGTLKKDSVIIYSGKWGEFDNMALRWETDSILYINGTQYIVE